jgi:hypothetical protein
MEHPALVAFLTGLSQAETFGCEITEEVRAHNAALASDGVGSIFLTEGPSTTVTRIHARRLLSAVDAGRLSFEMASYVADALIMSDDFDFEDDAVAEAIFFLQDDSRPPTREEIGGALSKLDVCVSPSPKSGTAGDATKSLG